MAVRLIRLMRKARGLWTPALLLALGVAGPAFARAAHTGIQPNPQNPERLHEIRVLAEAGAPALALARLEKEAPHQVDNPTWTRWTRERIRLLERTRQWSRLVALCATWPAGLAPEFLDWAHRQDVRALITLHDFRTARALLRDWIWAHPGTLSKGTLMKLEKAVVAVYGASGDLADAETALGLYRDQYPDAQARLSIQEARLLIRTRHVHAAMWMLAANRSPKARLLKLRARLIGGLASPRRVARSALALGADRGLAPTLRVQADQIAWQALEGAGRWHETLAVFQSILALANRPALHVSPPRGLGDELWQTLLAEGNALANRAGLVEGLGKPWMSLAAQLAGRHPWAALALLAPVVHGSFAHADREAAALEMAHLLAHFPNGSDLFLFLFLDPHQIPHPSHLPAEVRERLLQPVLAAGHERLAARLIRGLDTPPPGDKPLQWELTRLEINLYGGEMARARRELRADLNHCNPCPQGGRWLAAAFDLERVHLYQPALRLLHVLAREARTTRERRELLYWLGDDEARMKRWHRAAADYLWSAAVESPFAMDPWAQSARFKAARALAHAGLDADALRQYQALFNASSNVAQKALLADKIRHLKLRQERFSHKAKPHV